MKRVIGYLGGGVGNQLFTYAAAWAFAQRERLELVLDVSNFPRDLEYRRTYALQNFNVGDIRLIDDFRTWDVVYRLNEWYRTRFPTMPPRLGPILGERDYLQFEPLTVGGAIRLFPTIYILGYRQNEQYFADQAMELRRKLAFAFAPSVEARRRVEEIRVGNSVAVHFRQMHIVPFGDTRRNLLTNTYYAQAVMTMRQRVPGARFFCFGDSLANVDRLIERGPDVVTLPPVSDGPPDISDLWLMTHCRHFIISNSTFAWWAAWLGARADSLVFCPDTRGFVNGVTPARGWQVI
jgi:Glycosyl transferase family 11